MARRVVGCSGLERGMKCAATRCGEARRRPSDAPLRIRSILPLSPPFSLLPSSRHFHPFPLAPSPPLHPMFPSLCPPFHPDPRSIPVLFCHRLPFPRRRLASPFLPVCHPPPAPRRPSALPSVSLAPFLAFSISPRRGPVECRPVQRAVRLVARVHRGHARETAPCSSRVARAGRAAIGPVAGPTSRTLRQDRRGQRRRRARVGKRKLARDTAIHVACDGPRRGKGRRDARAAAGKGAKGFKGALSLDRFAIGTKRANVARAPFAPVTTIPRCF